MFTTYLFIIGMYASLCTIYLTEIAPLKLRGVVGCMHEVTFSFGALFASVLGLSDVLGEFLKQ